MENFLFILIVGSAYAQDLVSIAVVSSQVVAGNYSYYALTYEGRLALHLHSESGDADIYVSQRVTEPTFEPSKHCRQSSTCGLDVVHIPHDFIRPIFVGIYGHPSHNLSVFVLQVYYRVSDDVFEAASIRDPSEEEELKKLNEHHLRKVINLDEIDGDVGDGGITTWDILWSLFTIALDMML